MRNKYILSESRLAFSLERGWVEAFGWSSSPNPVVEQNFSFTLLLALQLRGQALKAGLIICSWLVANLCLLAPPFLLLLQITQSESGPCGWLLLPHHDLCPLKPLFLHLVFLFSLQGLLLICPTLLLLHLCGLLPAPCFINDLFLPVQSFSFFVSFFFFSPALLKLLQSNSCSMLHLHFPQLS